MLNKLLTKSIVVFFLTLTCCKEEDGTIKANELYTININFDELIPIKNKINMNLQQIDKNETKSFVGKIKRRGGYSIYFPKHSYEIKLKENISLCGLPKDDNWILNASYIDKTFIRHVISYELFTDMSKNNIVSQCQYVEVKLNKTYQGLYILMEKLDKSSLNINTEDSMAFIFKEPHVFRTTYDGIVPQYANNFHQQTYPKIELSNKSKYIEEVRDFILTSNDDNFSSKFSKIFDVKNVIDWHLLLLISNNSDGILKNFYLYKIDNKTPIKIAPWDYDHSFGRDGDNELNIDERPLSMERSILFKRLLEFDWYRSQIKKRWQELNNSNILSKNGLKQRVISKSNLIKEHAKKNFQMWPSNGPGYYDSNNFDEEMDIILKFIDIRHKRIQEYFDNL